MWAGEWFEVLRETCWAGLKTQKAMCVYLKRASYVCTGWKWLGGWGGVLSTLVPGGVCGRGVGGEAGQASLCPFCPSKRSRHLEEQWKV